MRIYEEIQTALKAAPKRWLVTGVAGFIGSNILERLLTWDQDVIGLDSFATGKAANLEQVRAAVSGEQWRKFKFIEGDIRKVETCQAACCGVEIVLHQAALGSVPRSIVDPRSSHEVNVTGSLNMFLAARDQAVRRVVYASSSAVYGDHPRLPKVESEIGEPLSPYAATKRINELYAKVCALNYGLPSIGLRYFNVFGPRQDPEGPYAAVIPKWIAAMLKNEPVQINGDGETSRDFCYVANAVQANILAGLAENEEAVNRVYNVSVGERTTLNQLFATLKEKLEARQPGLNVPPPEYRDFRPGDVRHSLADITAARQQLGYAPSHTLGQGMNEALGWYLQNAGLWPG